MTKELEFNEEQILAEGPWRCDQVKCFYSSEELENLPDVSAYVDRFWKSYKKQYPLAFNGPMLGLAKVQQCEPDELQLIVKCTSYAEYVATRDPYLEIAKLRIERSNPIGITVMALSTDGMVVITRRSIQADQNPGMIYFVGGYAEPPTSDNLHSIIHDNAVRELREELGAIDVKGMLVLSIASDPTYCHPEVFAVTRLQVTAPEIRNLWEEAQAQHEASEVMPFPVLKLLLEPVEALFKSDITWSFEAGTFLLRKHWHQIEQTLAT